MWRIFYRSLLRALQRLNSSSSNVGAVLDAAFLTLSNKFHLFLFYSSSWLIAATCKARTRSLNYLITFMTHSTNIAHRKANLSRMSAESKFFYLFLRLCILEAERRQHTQNGKLITDNTLSKVHINFFISFHFECDFELFFFR